MNGLVALGALAAALLHAPNPAELAPSGVAMRAESGGREPGCVHYTSQWVEGTGKRPSRTLLFDIVNRCGRTVWMRLAHQTGLSATPGGIRPLAPGQRVSGNGATDNYIFVYPYTTHLRFWLWQHDVQPARDPSFHNCHLTVRDRSKPPCPPGVHVFGAF